jgi:glucosamine-6-phosphate deaminase
MKMEIAVFANKIEMGQAAAAKAAELLRDAIARKGHATFVAATGASQFEFLDALTSVPDLDWSKTTMFHLDEYIGLPETHPASFRRYLNERLITRVHPGTVHLIQGDAPDPQAECRRLSRLLVGREVDVSFVGIGENGHLAFNDPPADFEVEDPYIIVELDEPCRRQQLGEGWFASLDAVPRRAISMSIKRIMMSRAIVCTVPERRKAQAVHDCFTGEVTPLHPASILRQHEHAHVFLDADAASLLGRGGRRMTDAAAISRA